MTNRIVRNRIKKTWGEIPKSLIYENKNFYWEYRDYLSDLSKEYNIDICQVSGIFAALSPLKSVTENKRLCENFLKGKRSGHFKRQIDKAKTIKQVSKPEEIDKILGGLKTINFFRNLYTPSDKNWVTVDRHILKLVGGGEMPHMTEYRYNLIHSEITKFSKEVNLLPNEVQSVLWYKSKELYGINI